PAGRHGIVFPTGAAEVLVTGTEMIGDEDEAFVSLRHRLLHPMPEPSEKTWPPNMKFAANGTKRLDDTERGVGQCWKGHASIHALDASKKSRVLGPIAFPRFLVGNI